MTHAISFEELFAWNHETAAFWKAHLEANPALLELPCDIGGAANVQELVRHIWAAELRWSQRIAGLPEIAKEAIPAGLVDALFGLHQQAELIIRTLLDDAAHDWDKTLTLKLDWLPPQARVISHRKALAHSLFHGQRHWAQLATLVRAAGFPSEFKGDILFSLALA
jgi:uncharacterized damage-inducible protein DinB